MNDAEIKVRILKDVNIHAETLIKKTYIKKANEVIFTTNLKDVIGSKVTKITTDIKVDTDGDGINDTTYTVKTDGSAVTASILTP